MILRIGRDLLFEFADRADRLRLLGEFDRGAGGGGGGFAALGLRDLRENLLGLFDLADADIGAGKPRQRRDIGRILGQQLRIGSPRRPA